MESDARTKLKEWLAAGKARLEPLSFPQRELWEASAVPPGDASNNICCFLDIRGPLTHAMCTEALGHVMRRHDALRTTFVPGKERPLQVIRTEAEPELAYRELPSASAGDDRVTGEMQECFSRPIDLLRGPLCRIEMLKRGPDHHALALAVHHSIADGWTLSNFVRDFTIGCLLAWQKAGNDMSRLGAMRLELPPLEMTYAEWAAAERAQWTPAELKKHVDYWRLRLQGAELFFRDRESSRSGELARSNSEIPGLEADSLRDLAKSKGATLFSVLLAAFRTALFRWMGETDVVVGTPVAGRGKTAARETMGYFSGNVPLRGQLDPGQSFDAMLVRLHREVVDDFAHAMPFAELATAVGASSSGGRHPLFDVRFAVQNHPFPGVDIPGISSRLELVSTGTARFDIGCEITEDARRLEVVWLHRTDVLTRDDVSEIDRIFRGVIGEVGRNPSVRPADIKL
jgi:hypothetical protein